MAILGSVTRVGEISRLGQNLKYLLCQYYFDIGQIFIVVHRQMLKSNLVIMSH